MAISDNDDLRDAIRDEQDKLLREMKRFERHGYVLTDDGRRVEIDHPDSPIRQAGMV